MAYAALLSVSQVIERILPHEKDYSFLCHKEQMEFLHQNVVCLQQYLENYYEKCGSLIDHLECRIVDVCYQIEDMIEPSTHFFWKRAKSFFSKTYWGVSEKFRSYIKETDSIIEEAMKMKEISKTKNVLDGGSHITTYSSRDAPGVNETKVGLEKDLIQIMEQATRHDPAFQIIPIVGMGGIGKTTLARAVYEDPLMVQHFDLRFWATISQDYNIQEILRGLLPIEERTDGETALGAEVLIVRVYQSLKGRRFLIVLDDMWHVEVWDAVRRAFPNDNNGSRVILTTRLSGLAVTVDSSSVLHEMQFLNEDQSWELFCQKVYGHECCPPEFEKIGKTIATNSKGLPLAIVVIAGLLKSNKTRLDYWEEVVRNISASATSKDDDELFGILCLSYTNLPPHLKACFLYMGTFPEDYEIPTKRLIMLWVAEGFIKTSVSKSFEDVAEEYLEDLVERNLVWVAKKRSNGKIKTCMIHDVMRELSIRKAQQVKFFQHLTDRYIHTDNFQRIMNKLRRICVSTSSSSSFLNHTGNTPVRSLLYVSADKLYPSSIVRHFKKLRVLDGVSVRKSSMLSDIYKISNLRYLRIILAWPYESSMRIPKSISKLQNLETLIFSSYDGELNLPLDIWKMPQLKHILCKGFDVSATLPLPPLFAQSFCILDNLQSLSNVRNIRFTESLIEKIPNLKKLKIKCTISRVDIWEYLCLSNLVDLHKLEELSILIHWADLSPVHELAFPQNLGKLTLQNTKFPWELEMSLIGSLPNLQVLNLLHYSFIGEEWEPIEGEFLQLKYLKISSLWDFKYWRVETTHFPCLETLIIEYCADLTEVPPTIGDIPTLKKLFIKRCCSNIEQSVRRIRTQQKYYENDALEIVII